MANINNRLNEYAEMFGKLYDTTPKAVFAGVLASLLIRDNGEKQDAVISAFLEEWNALHANGIIHQKPVKK